MLRRLLRVFKTVKGVQTARMGDCNIQNRNNAIAKSTKIAKRINHAKALTSADFLPSMKQPIRLTLWLKYAKSLKVLNYRILPKDFSFKDPVSFEDGVKKLFRVMKLNKVKVLRISELISDPSLSRAFLIFKDYPKSLERLAIHWEGYMPKIQVNPPPINTSLNHVKKLESISLKLDDQIKIVDYVLKSMASLQEVSSLSISLPVGITPENSTNLNKIQDFKNLKKLKLRIKVWKKDTKLFFQLLERMRFINLALILNIENNKVLKSVKTFLSQHKNLEYLQLKIENQSLFKAESIEREEDSLSELLDQVGQLRSMKSLKLVFKTRARVLEGDLLPDFTSCFRPALENSKSVKVFKFCCNQVKSKETFLGLVTSLKKNAKTLHNLTIDVGECVPEGIECRMTTNLLQDLKAIQILEIPSLAIACPYFIQDVVEVIYSLKYLRELILGEVKDGVLKNGFIDAVEKILLKKGLNKFICSASRELNRLLTKKTEGSRKLDSDEIKGKNPSLLQIPSNLPIFLKSRDDMDW